MRRRPAPPSAQQMIRDYLGLVSTAAQHLLPKGDRLLFVGRTRAAIEARVGPLPDADADAVAAALTALGDPAELAKRERERLYSARRRGGTEPVALWKPARDGARSTRTQRRSGRDRSARDRSAGDRSAGDRSAGDGSAGDGSAGGPPWRPRPWPGSGSGAPPAAPPTPAPAGGPPTPAPAGGGPGPAPAGGGPGVGDAAAPDEVAPPGSTAAGGASGTDAAAPGRPAAVDAALPGTGGPPPLPGTPSAVPADAGAEPAGEAGAGASGEAGAGASGEAGAGASGEAGAGASGEAGTGPDEQAGGLGGPALGPGTCAADVPPAASPEDTTEPLSIVPGMALAEEEQGEARPARRPGPPALLAETAALVRKHPLETVCVLLIGVGGLVFPFPLWLIGALVAWRSRSWDARDKRMALFGPLLVAVACLLVLGGTGTGSYFSVVWHDAAHQFGLLLRVGCVLCAAYLAWRLRRGPRARKIPPWERPR